MPCACRRKDATSCCAAIRGDPPARIAHHLAFSEWMRGHVQDPTWRPGVITSAGWEDMRWERLTRIGRGDPSWRFHLIDTSEVAVEGVAAELLARVRSVLATCSRPS
jgi:hypothetical protein